MSPPDVRIPGAVYVTRAPTDPVCARVSVGGNEAMGYYCTFRGPATECITALKNALAAMEASQESGKLEALPVDWRYKELGAS